MRCLLTPDRDNDSIRYFEFADRCSSRFPQRNPANPETRSDRSIPFGGWVLLWFVPWQTKQERHWQEVTFTRCTLVPRLLRILRPRLRETHYCPNQRTLIRVLACGWRQTLARRARFSKELRICLPVRRTRNRQAGHLRRRRMRSKQVGDGRKLRAQDTASVTSMQEGPTQVSIRQRGTRKVALKES